MADVISSFQPFSRITWWAAAISADTLYFDRAEHFQKASFRNRYCITGANGIITLSVPLASGRNQRTAMKDVRIHNETDWQTQHWRSLRSAYNRSPFFGHYEPELKSIFERKFDWLTDFCFESFSWVQKQLQLNIPIDFIDIFQKYYEEMYDLRKQKSSLKPQNHPEYQQVFAERNNFVPDLSILDLLFSEGQFAKKWIVENLKRSSQ